MSIRRLSWRLLHEIVAHSSQPDLTLAALSFCIAGGVVCALRTALMS